MLIRSGMLRRRALQKMPGIFWRSLATACASQALKACSALTACARRTLRRIPERICTRRTHGCRRILSAALLLLVIAEHSRADEADATVPSVTPYRPSVSTPAALSAPGWLEVEAGVQRVHASGADTRSSAPYTLKLAFTPDWGVRVGGEAVVRAANDQGGLKTGMGDTSVVLKRRFAVNEHNAFGLELGGSFATAPAGLHSGSGGTDVSLNGIYSTDLGAWHADFNLLATHLGQTAAGQGRTQTLFATALSTNLSARWGVVAELSGTQQRGADSSLQWLGAASFSPSRRVTFDAGVARSRAAGMTSWSAFVGATVLAARVF
jgi:hypothetical protein